MDSTTAFFYGTLMHPKILMRVISNDGAHLKLRPAILFDFTRHQVKYADYPGIIPYTQSEELFKRELTREERSVRGMLVKGLTRKDMRAVNLFEGSEYVAREVSVHPLEGFQDISAHSVNKEALPERPPPLPLPEELLAPVPAQTYVFRHEKDLEVKLWSYEDFVKEDARKWF